MQNYALFSGLLRNVLGWRCVGRLPKKAYRAEKALQHPYTNN